MIQPRSALLCACAAIALNLAGMAASAPRRRPAAPAITCAPPASHVGEFELHYGEFRRISGTLTASATNGHDLPIVAIEINETNRDTTVTLSIRNPVPPLPNGTRIPIFAVNFAAAGRGGPEPDQSFRDPISFSGPVHFSIDNLGDGRFTYRVDDQDPDRTPAVRTGSLATPMAHVAEINLLCAGGRFTLRDLRVEQ